MVSKETVRDVALHTVAVTRPSECAELTATVEAPQRRRSLRLNAIVGVTAIAVLVLYAAFSRDMTPERGRVLWFGVRAVPALVAFAVGWRQRDLKSALGSAALVMLGATLAIVAFVSQQLGLWEMLRSLFSAYALRELSRFVAVGLAAGLVGFAVRRWMRRGGHDR